MSRDRRHEPSVRAISEPEARAHLAKAEQYLRAASRAVDAGDHDAAAGNAVLAGINAADAVSGLNQGTRWTGAHEQAAAHLSTAGTEGRAAARELRRLLPAKTRAHYDASAIGATTARSLLAAAERAVAAAKRAAARSAS